MVWAQPQIRGFAARLSERLHAAEIGPVASPTLGAPREVELPEPPHPASTKAADTTIAAFIIAQLLLSPGCTGSFVDRVQKLGQKINPASDHDCTSRQTKRIYMP